MRKMKDSGVEWLGEIPYLWEISRVGNLFTFSSGDSLTNEDIDEMGCYDVYGANGVRGKYHHYNVSGKRILLGRVGALCGNVHITEKDVWVTEHALVSRELTTKTYYKYCAFLFQSMNLGQYSKASAQPVIASEVIKKIRMPLPSFQEQLRIACFLSSKCVKIDAIIAKQETIIEKLKEYKLSIITETVMSGINDVPMKKSNIDLCESIPETWTVSQIRYLFQLRDEKNYKPLEEVQLLSLYTDLGVFPHGEQEERGNKAVKAEGYKKVYEDDIIVNIILAWMGAIGRSEYNGVTSPAYDIYKPQKQVCSAYYHYMFRTKAFSGECYKYGRGIMAMRWRTYSSEFKSIKVPVPPLDEQKKIARYLDDKCGQLDKTIEDRKKAIEKLNEYKKALIYEVVTGKKEV